MVHMVYRTEMVSKNHLRPNHSLEIDNCDWAKTITIAFSKVLQA